MKALILVLLFSVSVAFAERKSCKASDRSDISDICKNIEQLYLEKDVYEDRTQRELVLSSNLIKSLKNSKPTKVINDLDFDQPFEVFFLLGSMFGPANGRTELFDTDQISNFMQALAARLSVDIAFRKKFTRYIAWTRILRTELRDSQEIASFNSILVSSLRESFAHDNWVAAQHAVFLFVYADLFDLNTEVGIGNWEAEKGKSFANFKQLQLSIQSLLSEGAFVARDGYRFTKLRSGESVGFSRTRVESGVDDQMNSFMLRFPNTIAPLLPVEKCSQSLLNFLDAEESNRRFCISL
jgi:hypothetical protein